MIHIDGTKIQNLHFKWSKNNKPIASIRSGDLVSIAVPDGSSMQVKEDWKQEDLHKLDFSLIDGAVGPIWVEEAKSGDTLEVEILEVKPGSWGWSTTEKNAGLIKGRFEDRLMIWKLRDGFAESESDFLKGIRIQLDPFLGVMGVSPGSGEFPMIPPQVFGGNLDNRLLTAGSKLLLPIQTDGALFSVGDPHAVQGDGESGSTGLETSADVLLRLNVLKEKKIRFPRAVADHGRLLVSMGVSKNLYEASKFAMEEMVDELVGAGFSGGEAYILLSLAGDLRISELVDEPNCVVSMTLPSNAIMNRR